MSPVLRHEAVAGYAAAFPQLLTASFTAARDQGYLQRGFAVLPKMIFHLWTHADLGNSLKRKNIHIQICQFNMFSLYLCKWVFKNIYLYF